MIPNEVFHYTKIHKGLEILFGKNIRWNKFECVNDPRESKEWIFPNFTGIIDVRTSIGIDKVQKVATPIKLKEWKVFCVSQHHHRNETNGEEARYSPSWYGYSRPSMWAKYGENHKGICLKFNGNKLNQAILEKLERIGKIRSGIVDYDDKKLFEYAYEKASPLNVTDILNLNETNLKQYIRDYFFENYEKMFLLKSEDWENEDEFRWLFHSEEDFQVEVSIIGILEEVILGCDFPEVYLPSVKTFCSEIGAKPKMMKCVNGMYGIDDI